MKASKKLEKELATLTSRRQQVADELSKAEQTAAELQERFVGGDGNVEQLASARARIGALRDAALPLDREIERLNQELVEAVEAEQEEARQARLKEIAVERVKLTESLVALRSELDGVLAEFGRKFNTIFDAWKKLRQEAGDLRSPIDQMAKWPAERFVLPIDQTIAIAQRLRERGKL